MMTENSQSVRSQRSFQEHMRTLYQNIDTLVYAAEHTCPRSNDLKKKHFSVPHPELSCTLLDVPMECPMRDYNALCKIPKLRRLIGDHFPQDDIKEVELGE